MTATGTHPQPAGDKGANGKNGTPAPAANGTAKAEDKALVPTPMQDFRAALGRMKQQIQMALPSHLDVERMIRIVCTTVQTNSDILNCTKESVYARIMQCAQLGLEPDGLLGHAWLVPFNERKTGKKICQLFIGYKGLLKLARNSGEVSGVSARVVQAKDRFEFEYGLDEKLVHIPHMITDEAEDVGEPIYVYAIVRMKDGSNHFEVMSSKEVERIRLNSPSRDSDAWEIHWPEMAKKTVLRKALKLSPLSIEDKMARAIALDERADSGLPQGVDGSELIDIEPSPKILSASGAFVVSSLKQRKEIAKLSEQARVSESDIAGWYSKHAVDDLSDQEADKAIARLKDVLAKEGEAA
jgi:recombination protein RecT